MRGNMTVDMLKTLKGYWTEFCFRYGFEACHRRTIFLILWKTALCVRYFLNEEDRIT